MVAVHPFDDNPCQPRHFKPPPCALAIPEGPAKRAVDACRSRLFAAALMVTAGFAVIAFRVGEVSLFGAGIARLPIPHTRVSMPAPVRADLVDRNGRLLATMLDSPSLYANPRQVLDAGEATRKLATALPGLNSAEVYAKLTSNKSFVWLERHLTPQQEYAVNRLGIPGLQFQHEERRIYPYGSLTSHVIGYVGIDNDGLAGVERGLDNTIKGRTEPVQLSIDVRLQYILHDELLRTIDAFTAKGGDGLIVNINTGEILAMVSLPDFDPNHPDAPDPSHPNIPIKDRMFNRVTLGDYEIGSVFKIFTTAMALDSGAATMTSMFDASHPIHIGRFTISDYHGKHRPLSVPEVLAYSSNIGEAKIALAVGARRQQDYLRRLGLLTQPTIELDEVGKPHFPKPWREVSVMTIGFGHGISETPLQVASAGAALVNGGILRPATLLKLPDGYAPPGHQVLSAQTSEEMRKLLRLVVEYGTGTKAAAPGYVVGGKTGTADKVVGARYADRKLLSSFLGIFPMNNPQYLVLAMIDEPHGNKASYGFATAGWTAAPAVSRIIERIAPLLGVQPVDESSPAIENGLLIASLRGGHIAPY